MKVLGEYKAPLDGIECVIYLTVRQVMSLIQKLDLFKSAKVSLKDAEEVVKGWNTVKDRFKEITSAAKFMDVIMQVRGGFKSSEDRGAAGLHGDEGEEFSILNDGGEDVHIIVQEWINMVYPFLKEMKL
jgi:hypothetical protein